MLLRRYRVAVLAWSVALLAFVSLAVRAATSGPLQIDVSLARRVQDLPDALGRLFSFENWLGDGLPLLCVTLIAALVLLWRGYRLEAACFPLTLLIRLGDVAVKHAILEPRPSPDLVSVAFPHDNLSFPSGHVIGVTLVFGLLIAFAPKLIPDARGVLLVRIVCAAYVVTICLARIWVGAHWPSDTLGGYLYAAIFLIPMLVLTSVRPAPSVPAVATHAD